MIRLAEKFTSTVTTAVVTVFILPAIGALFALFWVHINEPAHAVALSQIDDLRAIEEEAHISRQRLGVRIDQMTIELTRIATILNERLPPRQREDGR